MARPQRHRQRQLRILAGAAATLVLVVVVALLADVGSGDGSLRGTMGNAASLESADAVVAWDAGALNRPAGTLLGVIEASVEVRSERSVGSAEFALYLSRDADFSTDDCRVQTTEQPLSAGQAATVRFRAIAYEAPCVDVGRWNVAVLVVDTDQWIVLGDVVEIAGTPAELELATVPPELGWEEPFTVGVDVYRQASQFGLAGVIDQAVWVWLRHDETLCLASIDPISLPRDAERRIDGSWEATRVDIEVDPTSARRVRSDASLVELVSNPPSDASPQGPCPLEEGGWELAVGPVTAERFIPVTLVMHAAPVWISGAAVRLTLASGETAPVEIPAWNPSRQPVAWSAAAGDLASDDWLKGASSQSIAGGDSTLLALTVSAIDLQPGFYEGSFVVTARDYYRTEVRVPVELTVEARGIARDDDPALPGAFALSNYPNPFRGRTTLSVQLRQAGPVRLAVYDVSGKEVRLVADEWMAEGLHEIPFDANDLPSGTYLARIVTDDGALTRTLTLVN